MAISVYDVAALPAAAQKAIQNLQTAWNMAKGDKKLQNDIHMQAEKIRTQYGYSGGVDGMQYIPIVQKVQQVIETVKETASNVVSNPAATSMSNAVSTVSPTTTSTGAPAVYTGASGVTEVKNSGDYALLPAPMTPEFQRVLTLSLGVIALGFIAKMFSKGGR